MKDIVKQEDVDESGLKIAKAQQSCLSIVIPAFNESNAIGLVLEKLINKFPSAEIIAVDDASTDGTDKIIASFKSVKRIVHPFNRGYGASLKTGMRIATRTYIAWFDADNEHRVEDLILMLDRMSSSKSAAVIGERLASTQPKIRRFGKFIIRILARSLGANRVKDINCGLRIFHRDAITRYLSVLPNGFSASTTSTMIMMERGYPIEFFPISLNTRIGSSKVSINDGFAALFMVLRIILLIAPMRVFLSSGLLAISIGGLYGLANIFQIGTSFPISAFVVMTFGMFLCVLGLIADQLSQFRLGIIDNRDTFGSDDGVRDK